MIVSKVLSLLSSGLLLLIALFSGERTASAAKYERTYLLQPLRLAELKDAWIRRQAGSPIGASREALTLAKKVVSSADKVLSVPAFSVTNNPEKAAMASSGVNIHDYYSLAPYYWPDPSKSNGLPYIRRDGERNPGRALASDHHQSDQLTGAVGNLALAYHITDDEKYAVAASRFLRAFFLDPKTRMNPNMNHAQAILGTNSGRGVGIIDTLGFHQLADFIALLSPSASWTLQDRRGMREWCREYATWLQESKQGRDEKAASNNHGVNYDLQLTSMLLLAGKTNAARKVLGESLPSRMDSQITETGEMPREEARRTSWHYNNFNMRSLCRGAVMANSMGINLWNHETPEGRGSIRKAMLFLIPFLDHPKDWKFTEIKGVSTKDASPWLAQGNVVYKDSQIQKAALRFAPPDKLSVIDWLSIPSVPAN